jgi:NAD(P)-dependent dehydrogenase (short-subunit alcohol dehydrogenase family)
MTNLFDLTGEVAVDRRTGVLGGAIAEGLAAAGAKVAVLGRNPNESGRVEAIRKAGGESASPPTR